MNSLKAKALRPGDKIGIVSPSWGGAGAFPHRAVQGVWMLEKMGYQVVFADHAREHQGYVSAPANERVEDLHAMFRDPEIKMIMSSIGGDHSAHLLPLLDFDLIRQHPKIFMGFSDITVLNIAIWQKTGLTTFNGPALIPDFGEYPRVFRYTREQMCRMITRVKPAGEIPESNIWTEEFLDWNEQKDLERPRQTQPSDGWLWLKPGKGSGKLIGGCIESLQHLRGTPFWPDWEESIFFFETSEEKPSPETVDGILMDYENMGVFDQIKGMLVGRPMSYTSEEKQRLHTYIQERTKNFNFPVVCEMDFGHTSPQMTLPIGCRAEIDSKTKSLRIIEAAVNA